MNYTTNYHLPQWVEEDRILMEDFNQMCADIDGGIAAAKTAADTAREAAEALPYVVGTYQGNGGDSVTVTLGFQPGVVIVSGLWGSALKDDPVLYRFGIYAGPASSHMIAVNATGFTVTKTDSGGTRIDPQLNIIGYTYYYIAFR